jgi:hypothetical protein
MNYQAPCAVTAALLLAACDGGGGTGSTFATPQDAHGNVAVAADVPDACTFIPKAELEAAVGWELREGEPQSVPDGSSCEFRKQLGSRATKSFPNPAIPNTVGFTSLTISISPVDPDAVAEVRRLAPAEFEDVPGLGDAAYFLGPDLHVRVRNRGFGLRINPDAQSPDDQAKVRKVLLALGRTGTARL